MKKEVKIGRRPGQQPVPEQEKLKTMSFGITDSDRRKLIILAGRRQQQSGTQFSTNKLIREIVVEHIKRNWKE